MILHIFNKANQEIRSIDIASPATSCETKNSFICIPITQNDLTLAGTKLCIRFDIPVIDIQGYWMPAMKRPLIRHKWIINQNSACQVHFPYFTFLRTDQKNAATFALSCVYDDVQIFAKMNQERCCYCCEIQVAICPETKPFSLYWSTVPKVWHELLHDYRQFIFPENQKNFSEAAFQPVYCTWYAVHAALTGEFLDQNAKLASDLGFGTFIVDDGWCFDEMKRVTPKALENWYQDIGNWTVSEKKLPSFKKHVEYAQSLGLRYLLWTSPFFLGARSPELKAVKDIPEAISSVDGNSHVLIDPAYEPLVESTQKKLVDLVRELDLDGLKVDFLDYIASDVEKPRGQICKKYFDSLFSSIRGVNPDALLEFRQSYATPQMLQYGTQFRAGDVPFDFNENLNQIAQIRIILGDKVPCHADPVYFHEQESLQNISRHMIACLAGVPMFSMDLAKLKEEQYRTVKFWLDFYHEHFQTFAYGHWQVSYDYDHLSWLTVEGKDEKIMLLLNPDTVSKAFRDFKGHCFVLNLSDRNIDNIPHARGFGCIGEDRQHIAIPGGGLQFEQ